MTEAQRRFATFVAALGRGPGRSRSLTREEARQAFTLILAGEADPHQVGAFLMLLRYRGEGPDEISGIVEAACGMMDTDCLHGRAALDWPSYGAGRTRGAPWFLLAALAMAASGIPVLMHGTNAFSSSVTVADALQAIGLQPASSVTEAARMLDESRFAYLPLERLSPEIARLLRLRELFGLRSPVNTAVRLLDPARAAAGISGVFHPAYAEVHLSAAWRLGRQRLAVLKGAGGEAERNPVKETIAYLQTQAEGRREIVLPRLVGGAGPKSPDGLGQLCAVWRQDAAPEHAIATIVATIGVALLAVGLAQCAEDAQERAAAVWHSRRAAM